MSKSLWDFSVDLYACPGVADDCLQLQDDCGAEVCLLLAALWLERRGVAATLERVAQLERLASPWQAAVSTPLRQLRRAWKAAAAADAELAELRRQLASLELQAERILLQRLEAQAKAWPADAEDNSDWLQPLTRHASMAPDEKGRTALQRLRDAAGGPNQS
ncbi:TIGR02444 family protein [Pseudomonas sp. MAP12]|uniref:TIGR02444 family protein n=1 Tax=Geopseudomonas aromaticivorans TaxID=2849492 RepID=A0ABS6MTU9_9GAMM|nr:TIGR02444 family protein [Pseudomonas aromaticivorans]MBV2131824.1 TIGR02444 family protein [Pseudomonas aromaticivorans]